MRTLAWKIIVAPDKDVKAHQAVLEKVEKANAWEPNDPAILTALGMAQYRVGSYGDAIKTLAKAERTLSDTGEEPDLLSLALRAMTLHRIGRSEEAKTVLAQMHELSKQKEYLISDKIAQALLPRRRG